MSNFLMNRKANALNPYQGHYPKVLCVCSAGLLRSPTTAVVLSQEPYNFNTRAAGLTPEFALVPVDEVLLHWADQIVCMTVDQKIKLNNLVQKNVKGKKLPTIICLDIEDNFEYRDPTLMENIRKNYDAAVAALSAETK
jgi:predicted protein tyrosine phosphatase